MNLISIIIPTRNEEDFIYNCLKSVTNFSLPEGYGSEILISDGMSSDRTKEIILEEFSSHPIIIIDNEDIFQAQGLNKAIRRSKGEIVVRLDAHAIYPEDYIIRCFDLMREYDADNVGGSIVSCIPSNSRFSAKIVQSITTHPFGVGDSTFRTSSFKGLVDTVPYGFFKRELFRNIGFFNEQLIRGQDYEFNRRIALNGGKVVIDTSIRINYFNILSLRKFYSKQFYKEAPYNAYMWYLAPYSFNLRHAITGIFALGVIFGLLVSFLSSIMYTIYLSIILLYFFLAFLSGIQQAFRYKDLRLFFVLPLCFFGFHFIHGLGLLKGILNILFGHKDYLK